MNSGSNIRSELTSFDVKMLQLLISLKKLEVDVRKILFNTVEKKQNKHFSGCISGSAPLQSDMTAIVASQFLE